jgi:hypothetical protein
MDGPNGKKGSEGTFHKKVGRNTPSPLSENETGKSEADKRHR